MLPEIDGFTLARELRSRNDQTPILMLTARDCISDIVHGFDCGADDYLTKPFSFLELSARVRSLVRRRAPIRNLLQVGDLTLNEATREVWRGDREVRLTKTEFELLALLMRRNGDTVRRQELVREVWGANTSVGDNTLDASISSLRACIERPGQARVLHTVRGFGYRVRVTE